MERTRAQDPENHLIPENQKEKEERRKAKKWSWIGGRPEKGQGSGAQSTQRHMLTLSRAARKMSTRRSNAV